MTKFGMPTRKGIKQTIMESTGKQYLTTERNRWTRFARFSANTKTIPKGFQKTVKLKWAGKYHFRQNAGIVCKTLCHATILGWLWNF
jgi:hypothetical protein